MSQYSVSEIASLTGISAHSLRKWETRYRFISPKRTETNIRFYTDIQLVKLLNVSILIRNGYRVSMIDNMSEKELHQEVSSILAEDSPENDIKALVKVMVNMDEDGFNIILNRHITNYGLPKAITNLIYPFLNHVGVLWRTNKVFPAQEHFISNLIKQKIYAATDALPSPIKKAPVVVLFLPPGEYHEIGLLFSKYLAKELGWKVFYLGANVPLENIEEVTRISKPNLLMTMLTNSPNEKALKKLFESLIKFKKVPTVVAGIALETINTLPDHIKWLLNPDEFISLLNEEHKKFVGSVT